MVQQFAQSVMNIAIYDVHATRFGLYKAIIRKVL